MTTFSYFEGSDKQSLLIYKSFHLECREKIL